MTSCWLLKAVEENSGPHTLGPQPERPTIAYQLVWPWHPLEAARSERYAEVHGLPLSHPQFKLRKSTKGFRVPAPWPPRRDGSWGNRVRRASSRFSLTSARLARETDRSETFSI